MKKNKLLYLLFCLPALILTSCGETKYITNDLVLELKQGSLHLESSITSPIDIEDFIYCNDYSIGKCSVTVNSETKELNEHVYYPKQKGDHVFTYKAGNKTVSFTVNVISEGISVSYNNSSYIAEVNQKVVFKTLEKNMSLSITPKTATKTMLNMKYRPITVDKFDNYKDAEWQSYTYSGTSFTPANAGEYQINYRVTTETDTKDFSLSVIAFDHTTQHAKIYYDETNSLNGIIGGFYNVNGEEVTMHLPKASDYTNANYVALQQEFTLGQGVSVTWKGKNLPLVGMFVAPENLNKYPFGLYATSGYVIGFEKDYTDRYKLWGPDLLSGIAPKEGNPSRDELFGYQDLEDNTYYKMNVTIQKEAVPAGTEGYGRSINFEIMKYENYGQPDEALFLVLSVRSGNGNWVQTYKDIQSGKFVFYSSTKNDTTFKVSTFNSMPEEEVYPPMVKENVFLKNGTYTADTDSYNLKQVTYFNVKDSAGTTTIGRQSNSSFIALKGNYGEGTELTINFEGREIPNVCLFADKFAGSKGEIIGSGTGLQFLTSGRDAGGSEWLSQRIDAYGPHKLETGNATDYPSPYNGALGYYDIIGDWYLGSEKLEPGKDKDNKFKIGYDKLDETGTYTYIIKINKANKTDGFEILHTLKKEGVEVQTLKFVSTYITGLETSGNILIYGSLAQTYQGKTIADRSIDVKFSIKEGK